MREFAAAAERFSNAVAALLLFLMMAVTFFDVSGRYILHRPLVGSSEMSQYMLALMIFLSLPSITARGAHISIAILDGVLPRAADRWRVRFVNALSGVALMVIGYCMWRHAGALLQNKDVIGSLLLPVAPAAYAISALSFVTGLAFLASARK